MIFFSMHNYFKFSMVLELYFLLEKEQIKINASILQRTIKLLCPPRSFHQDP
jgi:hypothetical protein